MAITREIAQREEQMRVFEAFARRIAADPNSLLHKMVLVEHERQQREARSPSGTLLPAIKKAYTVTNHYDDYRSDTPAYKNPVCRGSFALGSACKHCEKCLEELEAMRGFGANVGIVSEPHPSGDAPLVHKGLPVAGYRKEQPKWAVDLVNQHKVLEEAVLRQLDHLKVKFSADVDQRQVALARTKLEEAFYHMNRAVFQPQRILDGAVSDQAAAILAAAGSRAGATEPDFSA